MYPLKAYELHRFYDIENSLNLCKHRDMCILLLWKVNFFGKVETDLMSKCHDSVVSSAFGLAKKLCEIKELPSTDNPSDLILDTCSPYNSLGPPWMFYKYANS